MRGRREPSRLVDLDDVAQMAATDVIASSRSSRLGWPLSAENILRTQGKVNAKSRYEKRAAPRGKGTRFRHLKGLLTRLAARLLPSFKGTMLFQSWISPFPTIERPGEREVKLMSPESRPSLESLHAENRRLKRAVEELSVLNQLATEIGSSLDSQRILERIVNSSLRAARADQGVLALVNPQGDRSAHTLIRATYSSSRDRHYGLSERLIGWMLSNKTPLLINSPEDDERFQGEDWDEKVSSLLSVPLLVKSQLIGILTVYNKRDGRGFTEDDQRLLAILASQSAQVLEAARLYEEEKELVQVQVEMDAASRIQQRLLPVASPKLAGYDIAGESLPARNVGGDFFDFIPLGEERLAICLGDVSGKGLPAALLMANIQATIRSQTVLQPSLKECITWSNHLLRRSTEPGRFATVFLGILDGNKQVLRFANAGHNPPFLFSRNRALSRLQPGGPVLGVLSDCEFEEDEVSLEEGDLLVIFSDGFIDAEDEAGEDFGEEKLQSILEESAGRSAQEIVRVAVESVQSHSVNMAQTDDMTLVVVKHVAQ